MTTREKLERKKEKREEWAAAREKKASEAFRKVESIASHIPMGQPILVGHHSEKRHRADISRMHNGMDQVVESSNMAKHHNEKADGIQKMLDKCIFSDDEDAIDRLQERIAELEKKQAAMVAVNKICRNKKTDQAEKEKQIRGILPNVTDKELHEMFNPMYSFSGLGFPRFSLSNNNANINRLKKRLVDVKRRQERQEMAEENGGVAITGNETYICVTFSEKPEYDIIRALKEAGFYWSRGSWHGERAKLPESVAKLANE